MIRPSKKQSKKEKVQKSNLRQKVLAFKNEQFKRYEQQKNYFASDDERYAKQEEKSDALLKQLMTALVVIGVLFVLYKIIT